MGVMSTIFYESMDMIAAGLGFELDGYEHHHEFATATRDIPVHAGLIKQGHVAGQHFEYIGLVGGRPVIEFQTYWKMSTELDKSWPYDAPLEYTVEVSGDPSVRCTLSPIASDTTEPGLVWTAMNCVNALVPVCEAAPGIRTSLDLPLVRATGRMAV